MTRLFAKGALLALYPLRVLADVTLGPDPIPKNYTSPTTRPGSVR